MLKSTFAVTGPATATPEYSSSLKFGSSDSLSREASAYIQVIKSELIKMMGGDSKLCVAFIQN